MTGKLCSPPRTAWGLRDVQDVLSASHAVRLLGIVWLEDRMHVHCRYLNLTGSLQTPTSSMPLHPGHMSGWSQVEGGPITSSVSITTDLGTLVYVWEAIQYEQSPVSMWASTP